MSIEPVELINIDGDNYLGLKARGNQTPNSFFKSRRNPWISESTSNRIKLKREAYLALYQSYKEGESSSPTLKIALETLSAGNIPGPRFHSSVVTDLNSALRKEEEREFSEFVKTLTDAQPYGMVGKGYGRNQNLAELITLFTYIYEQKPQNNPILYDYPAVTAQDFLTQGADISRPGARREVIENYMKKMSDEIQRIIDMSPQDLGMTFSDDDVQHVAIVRKLKLAFNRLSAELDYGKRFTNVPSYELLAGDTEILMVNALPDGKNVKKGKIYMLSSGQYRVVDPRGKVQTGSIQGEGFDLSEVAPKKDDLTFKTKLLAFTSSRGHTPTGEKTDKYRLDDCRRSTDYEHETVQTKVSMRRNKLAVFWLSLVFAMLIAVGQVAIAVFTATGIFAIVIGISCGVTNVFLFARDIKGVMMSLVKGDLTKGLSIPAKLMLLLWLGVSLATAIVAGGLVMVSLVALFGFAISTAPVWLSIAAGIISTLTVIGMASLFFQVGAGVAKNLRGKSLTGLLKSGWESVKSFFKNPKSYFKSPELNKETQELKAQVEAYKAELDRLRLANGGKAWKSSPMAREIQTLKEEYYPLRAHLQRELFAHKTRYGAKLFFTIFFVPLALVAAVVATYAFSVISATGTADTMKAVLGWSDKLSMTVSNVLTWGFSAIVNGALSAKNLVNVGAALAGKVSKVTVGTVYGVATFFNLAYHGMLWQTIKNGWTAFRENPYKTIIPGFRNALAVAFGAAIILNGYGNGATAGGGAISATYLPNWLVNMVKPETLTIILATASSMALNKAAIDDAYKADTPMLALENPMKLEGIPMVALENSNTPVDHKRRREVAFFDSRVRPMSKTEARRSPSPASGNDSFSLEDDESSNSVDRTDKRVKQNPQAPVAVFLN